ncbi:hypothetical protein [Flavobacterium sp.]|uniref:hypothetical protein n=1 Tax=Flavobacterium sp. TaxID=239 RepID=UPI0037526E2A
MITIPHKAKQFLVFSVKLLIVVGAFYFIYNQLANNDKLDWDKFLILFYKNQSFAGILFILLFSFLNRFFEILKWQNLAQVVKPITINEATKQVLAALTLGVFTPVGVGEYAGKALYFEKKDTKKIIFLNLICNGIQIVATGIFGIIGMILLHLNCAQCDKNIGFWSFGIIIITISFFLLSYFTKKIKIKGYSIEDLIEKINEIPKKIHRKNLILGFCRYLIFSHQYYFLFLAFDVNLPYTTLMATITTVYFLASIVPSFQFLDFALKGSLAIYFFGLLGVNEWIVVFVTMLMWFLNVVMPVVFGSYYVMTFKVLPRRR